VLLRSHIARALLQILVPLLILNVIADVANRGRCAFDLSRSGGARKPMVPVVSDFDQAISHATAPAFMLGAVAAFLSILIARIERIVDRSRALRAGDLGVDPALKDTIARSFARRTELLSRAIYFAVLSALVAAALLISAFGAALIGVGHGMLVALLFALSLALLMASLVALTLEIRVHMATLHLD
jgi:Protein of unknown function (DUF2721)